MQQVDSRQVGFQVMQIMAIVPERQLAQAPFFEVDPVSWTT
jgi:hypothetical protein